MNSYRNSAKMQKILEKSLDRAVKAIKTDLDKQAILKEIAEREQNKKRIWAIMSPGLKRKMLLHIERRQNAKK